MYKTTLIRLIQQTDETTSNTEHMEKRSVSQEKLLEQQFHDLLLELKQGKQDEYFFPGRILYSRRRIHSFSTSQGNIWVLPLPIYTQQTPDYTKPISPPHLENDFLTYSGATLNLLKNDTWNENKEYHKIQLKE